MARDSHSPLAGKIADVIEWWRLAGVENTFADEPQCWLQTVEEQEPPAPEAVAEKTEDSQPEPPAIGGGKARWPATLAEFQTWWQTAPNIDDGPPAGRVPPRGPAQAPVMIVVPQPEENDAARLLEGPLGGFLDNILAAMGVRPEDAYFASALPRHTPLVDWAGLEKAGLGELLRHHIALAAPQRVLVFGRNLLPLLGHDPAHSGPGTLALDHDSKGIPLFASWDLDTLLGRPRRRAAFWKAWLDWTEELA